MTRYRADYAYEEPEHRSDKLLVVMAEGTQGFGGRAKPIGLFDAAVVVATTDGEAKELWSQFGTDTEQMFQDLNPPPGGGAWVFEGCIKYDDKADTDDIRGHWRRPNEAEARYLCKLGGENEPNPWK